MPENRQNIKTETSQQNLLIAKAEHLPFEEIVAWLTRLRGQPFVAQSHFDVTSVLKIHIGEESYYVGGVNVENVELTVGSCAEEGALSAAVTAFGEHIDVVEAWVMGAPRNMEMSDLACYPCGECRQRLAQYMAPDAAIHIVSLDGKLRDTKTRGELLPMAFSFRDLEERSEYSAQTHPKHSDAALRLTRQPPAPLDNDQICQWMAELQSDVRVSGVDQKIIFRLDSGAYVAGVRLENAAYPSSTSAVQSAVALMHTRYGHSKIAEMWVQVSYRQQQETEIRNTLVPLSGALLQVLYQFVAEDDMVVNILDGDGHIRKLTLKKLISDVRTWSKFH